MSELDLKENEVQLHAARVAKYASEQVAEYEGRYKEYMKNKEEYAALAGGSKSDKVQAREIDRDFREIVREQSLALGAARFFGSGISQGRTSPGIEIFAYLWAKGEQGSLMLDVYSRKPEWEGLRESLNVCIHDMEKQYPAGTALLRSLGWISGGGIANLVGKAGSVLSR